MKFFKNSKIRLSVLLTSLVIIGSSFTGSILNSNIHALESGAYYRIRNVRSGHFVDVKDQSLSEDANVEQHMSRFPGAASQIWQVIEVRRFSGAASQIWQVIEVRPGRYAFINANSGRALTTEHRKWQLFNPAGNGSFVRQIMWTGSALQTWRRHGSYIQGANSHYLDVSGRSRSSGANIHTWSFNEQDNQRWELIKIISPHWRAGELYRIRSRATNQVLTADSSWNVVLSPWRDGTNNSRNQQWRIQSSDIGAYNLVLPNFSNLRLTVQNNNNNERGNIHAASNIGSWSQQWFIMRSSHSSSYRIVSRSSNKALDYTSTNIFDPLNSLDARQRSLNASPSQDWLLERLTENISFSNRVRDNNITWPNSTYSINGTRPDDDNLLKVGDTIRIVTPMPRLRIVSTYYIPTRDETINLGARIQKVPTGSSTSIDWTSYRYWGNIVFTGTVTSVDRSNPDYRFRIRYEDSDHISYGHPEITRNIGVNSAVIVDIPDVTIFSEDSLNVTADITNNPEGFYVNNWLSSSPWSLHASSANIINTVRLSARSAGDYSVTAYLSDHKTEETFNVKVIDIEPLENMHINNLVERYTQPLILEGVNIRDENLSFDVDNPIPNILNVRVNPFNSQVEYTVLDPDSLVDYDRAKISIDITASYLNEDDIVSTKTLTQIIEPRYIVIDIN